MVSMAIVAEDVQKLNNRVMCVETELSELRVILKEAFQLSVKNEIAIAQLSREMKAFKDEVSADRKRMNKQWGELANKMGTLIEDIFFPGMNPLIKQYFNNEPYFTAIRLKKKCDDLRDEFDIIAVCSSRVFLFEIKSSPDTEKARYFKEKKLANFRRLFPEYADLELIPFLGALTLDEGLVSYLTKLGIYAVAFREWEYLDILNFEALKK